MSSSDRGRAGKVGHTKSRRGCVTCKTRRVKCDETAGECGNCKRLGLECIYPDRPGRASQAPKYSVRSSSRNKAGKAVSGASRSWQDVEDSDVPSVLPESRQRRLMELRLLHHWTLHVSRPFAFTPAPKWGELWRADLPQIAFGTEGVLFAMLAMSATHLLRTEQDEALLEARGQYVVLALREQRAAVAVLDEASADALSFAALLINLNAFSMLRERSLDPYEPPLDWLEMGRGAGDVMKQARERCTKTSATRLEEIVQTTEPIHNFWQTQPMDADMRPAYGPILDHKPDHDLEGCREVYVETLNFIAAFRKATQSGEPAYVHLRRICMFPFAVPAKFIDFVRERRPRALVTLAYFFAVIAHTEALRYLGNTGDDLTTSRREICAIRDAVPENWHGLMIWPLDEVRAV